MCIAVFTDGGLCERNPSPIGGSWSYVVVETQDDGTGAKVVDKDSGRINPAEYGLTEVESNTAETVAVYRAMLYLDFNSVSADDKYALAMIVSDNENSVRRGDKPDKGAFKHIPQRIRDQMINVRRRLPNLKFVMIGGHPTQFDLQRGHRDDGKRVSCYNVMADELCRSVCDVMCREHRNEDGSIPYARPPQG